MCRHCRGDHGLFGEMLMYSMGYRGRRDYFGGDGFGDDGINRGSFAPVSQRAMGALDNAQKMFLEHLATVDTSKGAVTTEIIKFHLVPDMRKKFNKYVKEYGCVGTSRQITRAEQDLVNKNRKSLLWYTSVKVTPQAQAEYIAKNPHLPKPAAAASASAGSSASASASSASAASSSSSSSAATGGSSPNTSVSSISSGKIIRDLTAEKKAKAKLNEAAVKQASSSTSIKAMLSAKKTT